MDDIQLLLYIAFGVIYVLSRAFKKKKATQEDSSSEGESRPRPKSPSFEDLLREFTQETNQPPEYEQELEPEVTEFGFKEEVPSDEEIDQVYQESIKQAELIKSKPMPESKFQRFEEFDDKEQEPFVVTLMEELNDDEGLKKAVVYKEILDRKY